MVINKIAYILIPFLMLLSCNKDGKIDCLKSKGKPTEDRRNLKTFSSIIAYDMIDLILVQDTVEFAIINTGSNLIKSIRTDIKDGILTLKDKNYCRLVRESGIRHRVEIHLKNLEKLEVFGAVKTKSNNKLQLKNLHLIHNGVYDINLDINANLITLNGYNTGGFNFSGWANVISLGLEESSYFNGENLNSDDVYIAHYSPLKLRVNVQKVLVVSLFGYGNVFYKGNPHTLTIKDKFEGRGKLIKIP